MLDRPLKRPEDAHEFLINVVGRNPNDADLMELAIKISRNEIVNVEHQRDNTLESTDFRVAEFRSAEDRKKLRIKIIDELFEEKRPDKDSEICIGNGGSLPQTELRCERSAFIVLGPPASGKSRIACELADQQGAIILDPDHAKQKMPEFYNGLQATVVHEESSGLIFGGAHQISPEIKPLFERALDEAANIVIPKVGHHIKSIVELSDLLKKAHYDVHLVLVSLDRQKAVQRALLRFLETGRYVPLAYIFDTIGNEPQLNYYRLRTQSKYRRKWKSHAAFSTNVPPESEPELLCESKNWPGISFARELSCR